MMLKLSRTELYDLVWKTPMSRIAATYAVDAIRLANTCDQYDIPRPPPGYWQKLQYGKPVEKLALGNGSFPTNEIVVVSTGRTPRQTDRPDKAKLS